MNHSADALPAVVTLEKADDIPTEVLERAADVLRIISHPVRLRLIEQLLMGPVSVHELADHVGQAPAAISQHLTTLKAHGILDADRNGRSVYYRVISPNAGYIIQCIRTNGVRVG